jgi:type IV secretory pathway ATPase VirB11/archaellum biosynthesis ATPase
MRDLLRGGDEDERCGCAPAFDGDVLVVDADGCDGRGDLATVPACRASVVDELTARDADAVVTRADGMERAYEGRAGALLVAAGRFAERAAVHDETLAATTQEDPLGAARAATARAGPVADVAAETGLAACAEGLDDYETALRPYVAPALTNARIAVRPPPGAALADCRDLDTGAVARVYERPDARLRTYHVVPTECDLDRTATRRLADAHELIAGGGVAGGERAPGRAVRAVVDDAERAGRLAEVLHKHTRGNGVLEDLFADDRVSDVHATAPVERNPLRVVVDGEPMRSNVRLTRDGADALASRFRRASGRAFSRASPALDATTTVGDREVRVAGVTEPTSDGVAFAFRARDRTAWTLPALVANGTLPPRAAALLSVAVARGASVLVAGGRGAGKTTTLGALLWELAPATRTVCIEDTPELPVAALQGQGRDVQALRTTAGDEAGLDPTEALRTALRLGEGAIAVGEVRGEEARVLYEAMRVGAGSGAVLGTIHGDGAGAVRERVVADLGVPASSFAATDLVVTCARTDDGRRVAAVDEVVDGETFATLFDRGDGELAPTGRVDRGESQVVAGLADADESYAAVRETIGARTNALERAVEADLTRPGDRPGATPAAVDTPSRDV